MDADRALRDLVRRALDEDRATDDVTTAATVSTDARGLARLVARQECVLAGLDALDAVYDALDSSIVVKRSADDGDSVEAGASIATIEGPLGPILSGERTALNIVQRLSGVATLTRAFVEAGGGVAVRDTRKTTPGMRALEKAAVRAGGGTNHRPDLAAAILIKDNHVAAAGGIAAAVARARAAAPGTWIEVECDTLEQVAHAVEAGADEVLLDNMSIETLREAVAIAKGRARTEASGGITLETVGAIAGTGVDSVSVGALTHSAPSIDLTLEIEEA